MGARGWAVVVGLLLAGCAGAKEAQSPPWGTSSSSLSEGAPVRALARFVDPQSGFEISRPEGGSWQFTAGHEAPEGILVPVVVLHPATGSQVVVQVTPDVASPAEFADRLAVGLRSKPGFSTTIPASSRDGLASGFEFALGQEVHGRVGILDARDGRLFVLLATWPASAPREVVTDVEAIMNSLRPLQVGQASLVR